MPDELDRNIQNLQRLISILESARGSLESTSAQFQNLTNVINGLNQALAAGGATSGLEQQIDKILSAIERGENIQARLGEFGRLRTGNIAEITLGKPEEVEQTTQKITRSVKDAFRTIAQTSQALETEQPVQALGRGTGVGGSAQEALTLTQQLQNQLRGFGTLIPAGTVDAIIEDISRLGGNFEGLGKVRISAEEAGQGVITFSTDLKTSEGAVTRYTRYISSLGEQLQVLAQKPPAFTEQQIRGALPGDLSQRVLSTAEQAGFKPEDLQRIDEYANSYKRLQFVQQDANNVTRRLIVTTDQWGNVLVDTQKRFRGFFSTIARNTAEMVKWSAAVVLVWGPLRKLGELVEIAIDNESRLADIAVVLGRSQSDLTEIFDGAARAAKATGESIDGVLEAYALAYRATGNIEDGTKRAAVSQQLLTDALLLSKLSALDQEQALDTLVGGLRQVGLELDQGQELLNKWVAVSRAAAVGLDSLAESYAITATTAEDAGLSFDELNGLIAVLSENTILSSTEIGNAARAIISAFTTESARDELLKFGVVIEDLEGQTRPFLTIVEDIASRYRQGIISEAELQKLTRVLGGGVRRQAQVQTVIKDLARLQEVASVSANAQGDAYDALNISMETVRTRLTEVGNAFQILSRRLGEEGGILNTLTLVLDISESLILAFGELTQVIGAATPTLAASVALFAYLGQGGRQVLQARTIDSILNAGAFLGQGGGRIGRGIENAALGLGGLAQNRPGQLAGAAITGLAAIPRLQEGDLAGAGVQMAAGLTGALVGGPIGAIIGNAIGSAFVETVITDKGTFANFFKDIFPTDEIEDSADKAGKTLAERQEEARQELFATQPGGGFLNLGRISTTADTLVLNALASISGILNPNLRGVSITPEQLALFRAGGTPQAQNVFGLGVEQQLTTPPTDRKYSIIQQQTDLGEEYLDLLEQIKQEQEEAFRSGVLTGEVNIREFKDALAEIPSIADQITQLFVDFGQQFINTSETINTTEEAFRAFADILLNRSQEETERLTQLAGAIEDIAKKIEIAQELGEEGIFLTIKGEDILVPLDEARNKMLELQNQAAELSNAFVRQINLDQLQLPSIVGAEDIINEQDLQLVLQRASDLMQEELAAGWEAGLNEGLTQADITGTFEPFFLRLGGAMGLKFIEGLTQSQFTQALQQLIEEGTIAGQAERIPLRTFDISSGEFPAVFARYQQILASVTSQLQAQGIDPTSVIDEETFAGLFTDFIAQPITADLTLLNLAMQELIDINKKQLDGVYNLPADSSFFVPFQGYRLGFNNRGGGAGGGAAVGDLTETNQILKSIDRNVAIQQYEARREGLTGNAQRVLEEFFGRPAEGPPGFTPTDVTRLRVPESDLAYERRREGLVHPKPFIPRPGEETRGGILGIIESLGNSLNNLDDAILNLLQSLGILSPNTGINPQDSTFRELNQNISQISGLSTNLQLDINTTASLIVDGRTLATVIKPYLYEDQLRFEQSAGAILRTVVI